jgi:hypothetical protein
MTTKLDPSIRFWPLIAAVIFVSASALGAAPALGPLRVHPDNPRYFTDGTKMAERR